MDASSFSIGRCRILTLFTGFENQGRTPFAFEASLLFALPLPFTFAKLLGDNQGAPKISVFCFLFAFSRWKILFKLLIRFLQCVDYFKHLFDVKYELCVFVFVRW